MKETKERNQVGYLATRVRFKGISECLGSYKKSTRQRQVDSKHMSKKLRSCCMKQAGAASSSG